MHLNLSLALIAVHKNYRHTSSFFEKNDTKRALAGISLTLTPGLYGLLAPLAAWKTPPALNRARDHLKL